MTTIQLDPQTQAFYAGVSAGGQAADDLAATPAHHDYPYTVRAQFYWLRVGLKVPDPIKADPQLLDLFVQGALVCAPLYDEADND